MGAYEALKDAALVLKEAGKIEQYRQILETQEKLLDMQKRISELESENLTLKEQISLTASIEHRNNAYWTAGEKEDGPFCTRCWDVTKKLVRLHPLGNPAFHGCPECKKSVQTNPHYQPHYTKQMPPTSYE